MKKTLAACVTQEEVNEVISQCIKEYEAEREPKMRRDVFYALMKSYQQYHQVYKNLRDR